MISTLGALVVLAATLAVVAWVRRRQKRLDMPRPEGGVPILDNLLQVDPEKPHFTFTEWSRTLGGIFCVRMCGQNLVVANSFDVVHEVLSVKGHDLAGRPRNFRARCFTNDFRNLGFCNPCPEWRRVRRVVHSTLKMYENGMQRLEDITTGVVREMTAEVATLGQGSRAIDVRPLLYSATMNIMCVFLVGRRYRKTDEEFLLFQEMERLGVTLIASAGKGAELDAFPWLRWFGNETYQRLVRFSKLRDDLYERLKKRAMGEMGEMGEMKNMGERREMGNMSARSSVAVGETGEGEIGRVGTREKKAEEVGEVHDGVNGEDREEVVGGMGDMIGERVGGRIGERGFAEGGGEEDSLIAGEDGGTERVGTQRGKDAAMIPTLLNMVDGLGGRDGLDEEFMKGTFADLILGGTASTTNLVYSYLNIMLHHRSTYDRVKAEISLCLRGLAPGLIHHRPSLSDKATMPYTQASILELLRYVSIAPFTVPHQALVDTTIAGYDIPQGTDVLCNLWAVLHDEGFWGDPWCFRPERFLTDDGSCLVAPDHPNRRRLIAFGSGPRHCVGEVFALSRLFLVVTSLLRDFDLDPDPEAGPVSCDPRTYSLGMALYPPDFKLKLTPTCFYSMQKGCVRTRPFELHHRG